MRCNNKRGNIADQKVEVTCDRTMEALHVQLFPDAFQIVLEQIKVKFSLR